MTDEPQSNAPVTRSSLLRRLVHVDDEDGWREFCQTYQPLIRRIALRAGLDEEAARDVAQEVLRTLVRVMPRFQYDRKRSAFRTWLYQVVRSKVTDHFRREQRRPTVALEALGTLDSSEDSAHSPCEIAFASIWDEEWREELLRQALQNTRNRVAPRQFQIFEAISLQSATVREVCKRLGVSTAQVYLARHRVGRVLKAELSELARETG